MGIANGLKPQHHVANRERLVYCGSGGSGAISHRGFDGRLPPRVFFIAQ